MQGDVTSNPPNASTDAVAVGEIVISVLLKGRKSYKVKTSSNGKKSYPLYVDDQLTLAELAERVRTSAPLKSKTQHLRSMADADGKGPDSQYQQAKELLPAAIPASCAPADTPLANLSPAEWHTGLYGFDVDKHREAMNLATVRGDLIAMPGAAFVARSAGGEALYAFVLGQRANSNAEYKANWLAIRDMMPESANVQTDEKSHNYNRMRFLAHDPDAWLADAIVPIVVPNPAPPSGDAHPGRRASLRRPGRDPRVPTADQRPTPAEWLAAVPGLVDRSSQLEGPCPSCGGTDRFHVNKEPPHLFGCRKCEDPAAILGAAFGAAESSHWGNNTMGRRAPQRSHRDAGAEEEGDKLDVRSEDLLAAFPDALPGIWMGYLSVTPTAFGT